MIIRTVRSVTEWVCACTIFMSGGGRVGPYKVGGGVESWGGYVQHVIQVTVLNNAYGALILFKRCHVTGHNVHLTGVTRAVAPQVRAHTHTRICCWQSLSYIHALQVTRTHCRQACTHCEKSHTFHVLRKHCRFHARIAGTMHTLQAPCMHCRQACTHCEKLHTLQGQGMHITDLHGTHYRQWYTHCRQSETYGRKSYTLQVPRAN